MLRGTRVSYAGLFSNKSVGIIEERFPRKCESFRGSWLWLCSSFAADRTMSSFEPFSFFPPRAVLRDGTRSSPVARRRRNRAFSTHALTHARGSRVRDLKIIRGRRPVYVFTDPYVEDPDEGYAPRRRRCGRDRWRPTSFSTISRSIARRWEPRRNEPRASLRRPSRDLARRSDASRTNGYEREYLRVSTMWYPVHTLCGPPEGRGEPRGESRLLERGTASPPRIREEIATVLHSKRVF